MRAGIVWLLSGGIVLCGGRCAWAQAGRFIPRPIPNGGGGSHLPYLPIPFSDSIIAIALVVGALVILASVGYRLGHALGGGGKRSRDMPSPGLSGPATGPAPARVGPDQRDLILNSARWSNDECADAIVEAVRRMERRS